ncbi:phBC6A51 family helix-turn-helix protein [Aeribacillus sp. FSL K6-1121]|uniref:phBC6A51 family helix-turn-helix protein n=1 Tax=Aeribacillus sp. FSL K6-1121 TaxID=2954745 RepID=UPI0030F5C1C0
MQRFQYDETKLKPGQKEAAVLLVEYDFTDKDERKTKEEIAAEVGVSRMTLHRWETGDENFIAYKNYVASTYVNTYLPFVYKKLIDGISRGSMKGIELFLKRVGDLDERTELTIDDKRSDKSFEERKAELLARLNAKQGED